MKKCSVCGKFVNLERKLCDCGNEFTTVFDFSKGIEWASDDVKQIITTYKKATEDLGEEEYKNGVAFANPMSETKRWETYGQTKRVSRYRGDGEFESWNETEVYKHKENLWHHPDWDAAYECFKEAALNGSSGAVRWLAKLTCEGRGGNHQCDILSGYALFCAIAPGNALVQSILMNGSDGLCGGPLGEDNVWDDPKVIEMAKEAEVYGFPWAKYLLAKAYLSGKCCEKNQSRSLELMREVANAETVNIDDEGVELSDSIYRYKVLASDAAKRHLASLYFDGIGGVEQDITEAMNYVYGMKGREYKWMTQAKMLKSVQLCNREFILSDLKDYICSDDLRREDIDPESYHENWLDGDHGSIVFSFDNSDEVQDRIRALQDEADIPYRFVINESKSEYIEVDGHGIHFFKKGHEDAACSLKSFLVNDISVEKSRVYVGGYTLKDNKGYSMMFKDATENETLEYLVSIRNIILRDRVEGLELLDGSISRAFKSSRQICEEEGVLAVREIQESGDWNKEKYIAALEAYCNTDGIDHSYESEARYYLGRIYFDGVVTKKNPAKALDYFDYVWALPMARYYAAKILVEGGDGVQIDKNRAYLYLCEATEKNVKVAETLKLQLEREGFTKKKSEKAIGHNKKSAKTGCVGKMFKFLAWTVLFLIGVSAAMQVKVSNLQMMNVRWSAVQAVGVIVGIGFLCIYLKRFGGAKEKFWALCRCGIVVWGFYNIAMQLVASNVIAAGMGSLLLVWVVAQDWRSKLRTGWWRWIVLAVCLSGSVIAMGSNVVNALIIAAVVLCIGPAKFK